MDERQRRMVGHGAVVMVFGLLAGFGLVMSLIGGFEIFPGHILEFELPANSRAWARAHSGGLMNGLLVLVGAVLLYTMKMPPRFARHWYWMLVGAGYANTLFYWGALFAPSIASPGHQWLAQRAPGRALSRAILPALSPPSTRALQPASRSTKPTSSGS